MSWADTAARMVAECFPALGNDVTIGVTSGKGILKSPSESVFDGVIVVTDWMLELPQATWPTVAEGTAITVDNVAFLAREQSRLGSDGATVFVPLERLTEDLPLPAPPTQVDAVIDGDWL
jgi:hypothetical protein